ncbi:MAG: hypothetical protein RLZZ502_70, partial [Pseudomonadota bacterium]
QAQANQEEKADLQLMVGLDIKRKDIKIKDFVKNANYKGNGNKSNDNGDLHGQLGKPEFAEILLHREPTAYEQKIYDTGLTDPLEQLHRTVVLTYSSMSERDKNADKIAKLSGVSRVNKPMKFQDSAAYYPNEVNGFLGNEANRNDVNHLWGMHVLRFPNAWGLTKGQAWLAAIDGGLKTDLLDGAGVKGVHTDLRKNFRTHLSENFVDRALFDNSGVRAGTAETSLVHGMHVSGTMAAGADNAFSSISNWTVGGCPECSLQMMNKSNEIDAIRGIVKAVDLGTQVINMSFESSQKDHKYCGQPLWGYEDQRDGGTLCLALSHAAQNGVSLVAAAGNHGNSVTNNNSGINGVLLSKHAPLYNLPAVHPDVLAISGLTIADNNNASLYPAGAGAGLFANSTSTGLRFWHGRVNPNNNTDWWGSNYGVITNGVPQISFAAPAQQIISTVSPQVPYSDASAYGADSACGDLQNPAGSNDSDGIGYCTGTSMAAPHVSALAGLVKSANPLLDNAGVKDVLRRSAGCLDNNGAVSDSPCTEGSVYSINGVQDQAMKRLGYGAPKADRAVELALGGIGKRNRITPLFAHFQGTYDAMGNVVTRAHTHFYTTNAQMAISAIRGTLLPAPKYKYAPATIDCGASAFTCDSGYFAGDVKYSYPDGAPYSGEILTAFDVVNKFTLEKYRGDNFYTNTNSNAALPKNPNNGKIAVGGAAGDYLYANSPYLVVPVTPTRYPLAYVAAGSAVPGYSNLPCGPYKIFEAGTPCTFWHPQAVAMLMTTGQDTTNTGRVLKNTLPHQLCPRRQL